MLSGLLLLVELQQINRSTRMLILMPFDTKDLDEVERHRSFPSLPTPSRPHRSLRDSSARFWSSRYHILCPSDQNKQTSDHKILAGAFNFQFSQKIEWTIKRSLDFRFSSKFEWTIPTKRCRIKPPMHNCGDE